MAFWRKTILWHRTGTILSLVIALTAAGFTGLQWQETQNGLFLSTKPHVDFEIDSDPDQMPVGIMVRNAGPGTAVIKSVDFYVDNKKVKDVDEAGTKYGGLTNDELDYTTLEPDDSLSVGEKIPLIQYQKPRKGSINPKHLDRFSDFVDANLAVLVTYCSPVRDDVCWQRCSTKLKCNEHSGTDGGSITVTPEYTAIGKWLYDWQTLVGGILALAAGAGAAIAAYCAGQSQVRAVNEQTQAVNEQNETLKLQARRKDAQEGIVAVQLLSGVLTRIQDGIARLDKLLNQPEYSELVPPSFHNIIQRTALDVVWDTLGDSSHEIVENYLMLDMKLSEFSSSGDKDPFSMKNDLQTIRNYIELLCVHLNNQKEQCAAILKQENRSPTDAETT